MATLDEQLQEIERELGMRRRLYPRWVQQGTLTQRQADTQIARMEAVKETVRRARQAQAMTGMNGERIE